MFKMVYVAKRMIIIIIELYLTMLSYNSDPDQVNRSCRCMFFVCDEGRMIIYLQDESSVKQ